jgi:hypothetical protein
MMPQPIVTAERPGSFSRADREDFIAMVRAGGEVEGRRTLEDSVRDAERLAFARRDGCLVGVGAFERPKLSYRIKVEGNSGASLDADPLQTRYIQVQSWHTQSQLVTILAQPIARNKSAS